MENDSETKVELAISISQFDYIFMEIELDENFWKLNGEYNRDIHPEFSLNRGEFNYTNGNYGEALLDFNNYLKKFPDDYKATIYIAEIYCNTSRFDEAITFYENVLTKAKGTFSKHIYYNYATCVFQIGDFDKALSIIDNLLGKEKNFSLAYDLKANILLQLDKYENAYYYCTKSIEQDKQNWHAYATRLKVDYCLGDYYRAVFDFKNAYILNPGLPPHFITTYAFSLLKMNKKKEAVLEFEKAELLGDEEAKIFVKKIKV